MFWGQEWLFTTERRKKLFGEFRNIFFHFFTEHTSKFKNRWNWTSRMFTLSSIFNYFFWNLCCLSQCFFTEFTCLHRVYSRKWESQNKSLFSETLTFLLCSWMAVSVLNANRWNVRLLARCLTTKSFTTQSIILIKNCAISFWMLLLSSNGEEDRWM